MCAEACCTERGSAVEPLAVVDGELLFLSVGVILGGGSVVNIRD